MSRWLLAALIVLIWRGGFSDVKAAYAFAVSEGEPSSIVSSCVNALSGDFVVSQDDIIVEGVEPIQLNRSYFSGTGRGRFAGWFIHRHLKARFLPLNDTIYITEKSG